MDVMAGSGGRAAVRGADLEAALLACAAGDRQALRRIYDTEAPRMLTVAARLLKRPAAAEDAVHDAFVLIWNKAASYDPDLGSARAWIYTILRNRALNMLRSEQRVDSVDDVERLAGASEEDDPEVVVSRLSEESALRRCLERLEPKRRAVILLVYTNGLTHGELAGRMGLPLGTMKSWIRRGLAQLRECLG